jgi:hypothetical protein
VDAWSCRGSVIAGGVQAVKNRLQPGPLGPLQRHC